MGKIVHTIVLQSSSTALALPARRVHRGSGSSGCRDRTGTKACIRRIYALIAFEPCREELQGAGEEIANGIVVCGGGLDEANGSGIAGVVSGFYGCFFPRCLQSVEAYLLELSRSDGWRSYVVRQKLRKELGIPSVPLAACDRLVCARTFPFGLAFSAPPCILVPISLFLNMDDSLHVYMQVIHDMLKSSCRTRLSAGRRLHQLAFKYLARPRHCPTGILLLQP